MAFKDTNGLEMASAHVFLLGDWVHECSDDEHFIQTGNGNKEGVLWWANLG